MLSGRMVIGRAFVVKRAGGQGGRRCNCGQQVTFAVGLRFPGGRKYTRMADAQSGRT